MKRFLFIFLILPLFFVSCDSSKNISSFDEDEFTENEAETAVDDAIEDERLDEDSEIYIDAAILDSDVDDDEQPVVITQKADTSVNDYGGFVAVNSKGSIFVVGSTRGGFDGNTNFGQSDVFLTKWSVDGTKAWTKQWGSPKEDYGASVAIDKNDNIFVLGMTKGDIDGSVNLGKQGAFLTKFTSDGKKIWTKQWGSASYVKASSVAVDNKGDIFVTGFTANALDGNTAVGKDDIFLTKWKTDGTKVWTKQWGTAEMDRGTSVAIDNDGNIFVAGNTSGDFDGNMHTDAVNAFLIKLKSDGTREWTKQWGTANYHQSVAIDSNGNIFITGFTVYEPSVQSRNIFLAKWNSDGEEIWVKYRETTDNSYGNYLAIDSKGDLFVLGYEYKPDDESDIILTKWNSDGTQGWIKQWESSEKDFGQDIAIDSKGNIFITGYTEGDLDGNITAGGSDLFLVKWKSDGTQVWTKQWGASFFDYANAMAFDKNENIYLVGATKGSFDGNINLGGKDIFLTKWNSDGTREWTKQWGTLGDDEGNAIAIDSDGNIFITGLTGGDLDGNTSFGERDVFLTKLTSDGTKIWTKQWGDVEGDTGNSVAIDKNGSVFVAGCFSCGSGYYDKYFSNLFLTKWSQDGEKLWTEQKKSVVNLGVMMENIYTAYVGESLIIDSNENILVVGSELYAHADPAPSSPVYRDFIANWNQAGDAIWQRVGFCGSYAKAVSDDDQGGLFVTGYKRNDYGDNAFLAKLQSDSTKVWSREWGTLRDDTGNAIALDSNGNIFVLGSTRGIFDENITVIGQDVFLTKWTPDGTKVWTRQWGTGEYDYGKSIIVDSKGNIFVTGYTKGDFDGNRETEKRDLFLTKWSSNGIKLWTKQWGTSRADYGY